MSQETNHLWGLRPSSPDVDELNERLAEFESVVATVLHLDSTGVINLDPDTRRELNAAMDKGKST